MKVRQGLLKFISPEVPVETRRCVASALASGAMSGTGNTGDTSVVDGLDALSPADSLTTLFILSFDPDSATSIKAAAGFTSFDPSKLTLALGDKLDPRLLRKLASLSTDPLILSLISANPGADNSVRELVSLKCKVGTASVSVLSRSKLIATKSAVEQVEEEVAEDDEGSLYQRLQGMNTAEKIKLGLTGGKAERGLLINDANKVVSNAVLKNPRITNGEIVMVVNSKTASDEVLRMVARNKDWLKHTSVKLGLIKNPKTPLPIAMRLLDYIDKRELARLAKSKNISSVLSSNALRKMERIR